ncbi:hypothetical protein O6H91_08G114500 [Diphasiastrum complanatum]|uniref:Uncharacterized protein n=1 Tax=Diphasiastrum complanatum TaxID=34168 RepID=A0ACC2D185_DIPCM|nr:hypothetical protein O6H91_Y031900 [Diphasiastrum complanatum]KAJ7548031.1 hypothetical protein O6H91_08G114500 [Diphasiastrum complanatum]
MGIISKEERVVEGSIVFSTIGRCNYAFDVFSLPVRQQQQQGIQASFQHLSLLPPPALSQLEEIRHTSGKSVSYNGHAVERSQWDLVLFQGKGEGSKLIEKPGDDCSELLAYVSEDGGALQIRFVLSGAEGRIGLETSQTNVEWGTSSLALRDKPSVAGGRLVYVSTEEASNSPRESWNAVYSTHLKTRSTTRLTPQGVSDFSPAISPSVASNQEHGWQGEIEGLCVDIYVCNAADGTNRRLLVKDGGWPSWANDHTLYFHRQADDGWWSVFKVNLSAEGSDEAERVTPPGLHAFTPAASQTGQWIAVATRRQDSDYRHVEIFDMQRQSFQKITSLINPHVHHYNPFVFPNSDRVGYHRCREVLKPAWTSEDIGDNVESTINTIVPHLEPILSPIPRLALLRIDGAFPAVSPDGCMIAYIAGVGSEGLYAMNLDGTGRRKIYEQSAFGTDWDTVRKGIVYTSLGPAFATEDKTVHIAAVHDADIIDLKPGEKNPSVKILTKPGTQNNAFPSVSPDGKYIVFRSGRSGHKNLFIMDAAEGEAKYLRRLTEGAWTDTMPNWAPNNEWISFCSDREKPGKHVAEGSFAVYYIRPDGTGLHKVIESVGGGKVNHPWFSPDSKSILFTSDIAGVSAEPISVPHQFQPYGDLFVAKADGTELVRLTQNAYEDGTPSWGSKFIAKSELTDQGTRLHSAFSDVNFLNCREVEIPPKRICGWP